MMSHLKEIKKRIVLWVLFWCLCSVIVYFSRESIFLTLLSPLKQILPTSSTFITTHIAESFIAMINLVLGGGFILSLPFAFYQLWKFITPGLYAREKIFWRMILWGGIILFFTGATFAHTLILPLALIFLQSFGESETGAQFLPSLSSYLGFYINLIFAFALSFEFPIFLLILGRLGIIQASDLQKSRRIAIVGIFILAAVVTPPDILSQVCLALPLMGFYEGVVFLILRMEKFKKENFLEKTL
jgi:sec-independent protein translocase protein TatC